MCVAKVLARPLKGARKRREREKERGISQPFRPGGATLIIRKKARNHHHHRRCHPRRSESAGVRWTRRSLWKRKIKWVTSVARPAGWDGGGRERGGCAPGWVDFFITAAIIAPSDCASRFLIMSRGRRERNILVSKIIAADQLSRMAPFVIGKSLGSRTRTFFPASFSLSFSFSLFSQPVSSLSSSAWKVSNLKSHLTCGFF